MTQNIDYVTYFALLVKDVYNNPNNRFFIYVIRSQEESKFNSAFSLNLYMISVGRYNNYLGIPNRSKLFNILSLNMY